MATVTLNHITRQISGFARRHGQLSSESFGRPLDQIAQGDVLYPGMFYILSNVRREGNELQFLFRAEIADRINHEGDPETDVWNDAIIMACDLLAFLDSDDREFELASSSAMTPFTAEGADLVAGVQFDFTLKAAAPMNTCLSPVRDAAEDGEFLMTEDGRFILTESGHKILLETPSGRLMTENGQYILTEDGSYIITE